jgi:hypothetical protein
MNGEGVAQDLVKAYCLFTEASNKEHKEAIKKLMPFEIRLVFIPYLVILFTNND